MNLSRGEQLPLVSEEVFRESVRCRLCVVFSTMIGPGGAAVAWFRFMDWASPFVIDQSNRILNRDTTFAVQTALILLGMPLILLVSAIGMIWGERMGPVCPRCQRDLLRARHQVRKTRACPYCKEQILKAGQ